MKLDIRKLVEDEIRLYGKGSPDDVERVIDELIESGWYDDLFPLIRDILDAIEEEN